VSGGALGTAQKLLARRGVWTLFRGDWTNIVKVIGFQSFYGFKN